MDIDELLQHDASAEGIFVSRIPLGSAARPVPDGLNESDRRSFHAATHDSASHSLPLPSPVVPSPAWPLHAFHRSPTVDYPSREVCTQLGSSSLVSHSVCKHVQASTHIAVDGPSSVISSSDCNQSFCAAAPNSDFAPSATALPPACASSDTPAACCSQPQPTCARSLASATARPPGPPFACASPPPVPACPAVPVSALFANSGPSKRRLLFVPGPKLAKRLKLG